MTPEQQSVIEWQLKKLNYASAYYLDTGDYDKLINLYTPDAYWDRAGHAHRGRDEIRKGMLERPSFTTRHLVTNMHFFDVTEDQASGVNFAVVFHGPAAQDGESVSFATAQGRVLDFHDTYALHDGQWKIASRVAKAVLTPDDWPGNFLSPAAAQSGG